VPKTRKDYECKCWEPPVDLIRGEHELSCPMAHWKEVQDEIAVVTTTIPRGRPIE
jgi:hypothetical protein